MTYDDVGDLTLVMEYDGSNKKTNQTSYMYEGYVGTGKWIKQTQYDASGKRVSITDREFEFYPQ